MDDRTFSLRAVTELTAEQERQWDQLASLSKVGRLYSSAPWSHRLRPARSGCGSCGC